MKRAYVDIPEGQIHYRTEGTGSPLLLLAEAPSSSATFARVIPILAKKFRVIAMDHLGFGSSDTPPKTFEIPDYARAILHFLEALGIDKVSIVGHHSGSVLAVEVATTRPEMVDKLVLSGLVFPTESEVAKQLLDSPRFTAAEIDEEGQFVLNRWKAYRSLCQPGTTIETFYPLFVDLLRPGSHTFDLHKAVFRHDVMGRLPLVKCPTLVLRGTNDVVLGDESKVLASIAGCQSKVMEGGGVFIALGMPEAFAQAVLDFV